MNAIDSSLPGQYMEFILDSQHYALPITIVREIIQLPVITPLPQTPEYIKGVFNIRGQIIPVIDLRMRFEITSNALTRQSCVIIIQGESEEIGLIVDSVNEVIDLDESTIEEAPEMGIKINRNFITAIGRLNKRMIILINSTSYAIPSETINLINS